MIEQHEPLRIGVLSDTHGRVGPLRAALARFDELGASMLVHCGDVGGVAVFDELVGRDCRFVWGNTDEPDAALLAYLATTGLTPPDTVPRAFEVGGRRFEVYHGHESAFRQALAAPVADYILHGHTHVPRDERVGSTRVINPGALHRAHTYTVALIEPALDQVEFHEIT